MDIKPDMIPAVMSDLLVVYLAGDASAETRVLVEKYAQENEQFAALLLASSQPLPQTPPGKDSAMETLEKTRKYLKLQKILFGTGLFFSLMPFTVLVQKGKVTFLMLRDAPTWSIACACLSAAAWICYWVAWRRVAKTGL